MRRGGSSMVEGLARTQIEELPIVAQIDHEDAIFAPHMQRKIFPCRTISIQVITICLQRRGERQRGGLQLPPSSRSIAGWSHRAGRRRSGVLLPSLVTMLVASTHIEKNTKMIKNDIFLCVYQNKSQKGALECNQTNDCLTSQLFILVVFFFPPPFHSFVKTFVHLPVWKSRPVVGAQVTRHSVLSSESLDQETFWKAP